MTPAKTLRGSAPAAPLLSANCLAFSSAQPGLLSELLLGLTSAEACPGISFSGPALFGFFSGRGPGSAAPPLRGAAPGAEAMGRPLRSWRALSAGPAEKGSPPAVLFLADAAMGFAAQAASRMRICAVRCPAGVTQRTFRIALTYYIL